MAGRWFRFDADFADHHKAIRISPAARWLFVASVGYCWRHETDGWVPAAVVRRLLDDPDADRDTERRLVDELLAVGLWERDEDDYRVHDYLDHQPSSQQRTDERDGSRDRQRRSRERRAAQGNGVTPPPDDPGPQGARDPGDGHTDVTRDDDDRHTSRHAPSQRKKTVDDVTVEDSVPPSAGRDAPAPAPPELVVVAEPVTAQTLLAEYLDTLDERPPSDEVGQLAQRLKRLVNDGIDPAHIRAGLADYRARDVHPSVLPSLVAVRQRGGQPRARPGRPGRAEQQLNETLHTAADMLRHGPPGGGGLDDLGGLDHDRGQAQRALAGPADQRRHGGRVVDGSSALQRG